MDRLVIADREHVVADREHPVMNVRIRNHAEFQKKKTRVGSPRLDYQWLTELAIKLLLARLE
jgi:hypothetical protein